jgi:hypothetical protein
MSLREGFTQTNLVLKQPERGSRHTEQRQKQRLGDGMNEESRDRNACVCVRQTDRQTDR